MEEFNTDSIENSIQEIDPNHACPICLNLIVEPVAVQCGHSFCKSCFDEIIEQSSLTEDIKCPMCRTNLGRPSRLSVNNLLKIFLLERYPLLYENRLKNIVSCGTEKIRLLYGNGHHRVINDNTNNTHLWTVFVSIEGGENSMYIKKVYFKMHSTFGTPRVRVERPPFQVTRIGWGTFEIPITIYWQDWLGLEPTVVNHHLSFEGNGTTLVKIVKIPKLGSIELPFKI